jgi:hypothetical protein
VAVFGHAQGFSLMVVGRRRRQRGSRALVISWPESEMKLAASTTPPRRGQPAWGEFRAVLFAARQTRLISGH